MKKTFATFLIVGALTMAALSACEKEVNKRAAENSRFTYEEDVYGISSSNGDNREAAILTDKKTGCRYISFSMWNSENGLTALLKEDGTPDCGKAE